MGESSEYPSRLKDPAFLEELRKVLAIDFGEILHKPEWVRMVPNSDQVLADVRIGKPIIHRTYLDAVLHTVAESFTLSESEEKELRKLVFRPDL